jgi:hypothetical protein
MEDFIHRANAAKSIKEWVVESRQQYGQLHNLTDLDRAIVVHQRARLLTIRAPLINGSLKVRGHPVQQLRGEVGVGTVCTINLADYDMESTDLDGPFNTQEYQGPCFNLSHVSILPASSPQQHPV